MPEESLRHSVLKMWPWQFAENVPKRLSIHPLPAFPFLCSTGAVASSVVKQKLAEVILKKQQAALERTVYPSIPIK